MRTAGRLLSDRRTAEIRAAPGHDFRLG